MAQGLKFSMYSTDELKEEHMNPVIYYTVTTIIYVICVIGGIFVKDLGPVFDLISALTLSFLCFIWPGGFYIIAENRYGDPSTR